MPLCHSLKVEYSHTQLQIYSPLLTIKDRFILYKIDKKSYHEKFSKFVK